MTKDQFIKELKKKVKSLKVPQEYWGINLDEFFQYQWNIYLSIRETAGKTTQSLLLGLCAASILPEHYGTFAYLRNDVAQITRGHIETLFGTVENFGYIAKIFNNRWNGVVYKAQQRKFYLVNRDPEGSIIDTSVEPICSVHAVEKWMDDKSSVNLPTCGLIIYDEILDTNRATYRLFTELLNQISTIGRPMSETRRPWLHILGLGNNTDAYGWIFDDLMISEDIPYLSYGGNITFKTEYNTTGVCRLLELGEPQKKRLADKNIPFLGFPGKKAASFTGAEAWSGKVYRHPDFELDYENNCKFRRAYVFHRGRYIQFDLFADEEVGKYVFCHFASKPKLDDNIIFTLEPSRSKDIYGFGKYEKNEKILRVCKQFVSCLQENRFYYASNRVGSLIDDYIKNIV